MLAEKLEKHDAHAYLLNTGWVGGGYGVGKRCPLKYTRTLVDAIHSGELVNAEYDKIDLFHLQYPKAVKGVPDELLNPKAGWKDPEAFDQSLEKLAGLFKENFIEYADKCSYEVKSAGPFF